MRSLLLGAALLLAVSSPGIADDSQDNATDTSAAVTDNGGNSQNWSASQNEDAWQDGDGSRHRHGSHSTGGSQNAGACVQGFQTMTCGSFTGCALPTWQCCPNSSNGGWQWADNSSACPI